MKEKITVVYYTGKNGETKESTRQFTPKGLKNSIHQFKQIAYIIVDKNGDRKIIRTHHFVLEYLKNK